MALLVKDSQESQKILSKIIAKTWLDEKFKEQFISNTNATLEENGLTLPNGVEFKVQENTLLGVLTNTSNSPNNNKGNVVCEIPLPPKPPELTDQQIQSWIDEDNSNFLGVACDDGTGRGCC